MIQRLQSIYLLLAGLSIGGQYSEWAYFLKSNKPDGGVFADSTFNVWDNMVQVVLWGISLVLCLAAIFLYKNRKLQTSILKTALFVMTMPVVSAYLDVWEYIKNVQDGMVYSWGIVTPVLLFVTFVLILLALMAIKKDEQTVQSMDRLR